MGGRNLIHVLFLEAAIFDFMTEEDWGEYKYPEDSTYVAFASKTFARPKKTPALQAIGKKKGGNEDS